MAILQAYQADVLKEMDEGTGLTPEAVKELRRATDLALRATKHTALAVGRSMAASVAAERHLWLKPDRDSGEGKDGFNGRTHLTIWLLGDAVSAVVDKFRSAKTQSAALKSVHDEESKGFFNSSSVPREQQPPGGSPLAAEPRPRAFPPLRLGEPAAGLLPANNHASVVNMKRPNKPAASANPGRS